MNAPRDPETVLAAWLEGGPSRLPDATRRAISVSVSTTPQARRGLLAPWRINPMRTLARSLAAAVAVVVLAGAAIYLIGPRIGGSGGSATPTPPLTAQPTAAPTDTTSPTDTATPTATGVVTYSSARFQYGAQYPGDWTLAAATSDWPASALSPDPRGSNVDDFTLPAGDAWIFVSSRALRFDETPTGMASSVDAANASACDSSNEQPLEIGGTQETSVDLYCDGPIQIGVRKDHYIEIFTIQSGRAYFVDFLSPDNRPITADDRAAFAAFVASFTFGAR
jgi:hypothetical protein